VLFLFVVMMLDINFEEMRTGFTRYFWLGCVVAGIVVFELVSVLWTRGLGADVEKTVASAPADYSNTVELGRVLYTEYVYPFELAAVLLLIAIVAAISLTMRKRAGLKQQDIAKQVAVRSKDRVRIVQVASEKTNQSKPAGDAAPESSSKGTGP
jgi:NADH-quinone oxidoreductase subunit J